MLADDLTPLRVEQTYSGDRVNIWHSNSVTRRKMMRNNKFTQRSSVPTPLGNRSLQMHSLRFLGAPRFFALDWSLHRLPKGPRNGRAIETVIDLRQAAKDNLP